MNSETTKAELVQSGAFGNLQPAGFPGLPQGWVSDWDTFPSADQSIQLFEAVHRREDWGKEAGNKTHRALLVLHGMGEHGGRYLHLPHFLENAVDAVICLDQRGHGRSEGLRGHCDRFTQFTDDFATTIARARERIVAKDPRCELHVLGHSFGGLVALRTHFLNPALPVKSLCLSSPLLGIKVKVPVIKGTLGKALSGIWGSLQMSSEVHPSELSHDPAVGAAYVKDRLVHNKITPRMFTEMLAAIDDTVSRDAGLAYPLLMQVCLQDMIADPDASQGFFQKLKIREKKLLTYPGFFHEGMNEVGKEKFFEDLNEWLTSHRSQNSAS